MTINKRGLWVVLFTVGLACVCCLPAAFAEQASAGAESSGAISVGTLWQWVMQRGGKLSMYVLSAMSVLMLAFILYFVAVLRRGQVAPVPLLRELLEKIKQDDIEDARRACEYHSCPLSTIVLVALDYIRHVPDMDPVLLKDVIEGEGGRQAETIHGQTQYLLDIAIIAPMVGLLGTVFGMLRAFRAVQDIASAKPVLLAEGITMALQTTAFGLMVGIPAMMFYAYFRRQSSRQVSYLESAATDIMIALIGKKTKKQGEA